MGSILPLRCDKWKREMKGGWIQPVLLIIILSLFLVRAKSAPSSTHSYHIDGVAMNMEYHITLARQELSAGEKRALEEAIAETFMEVNTVYNQWNTLSEMGVINDKRCGELIPISAPLREILLFAQQLNQYSAMFDPTIEVAKKPWIMALSKGEWLTDEEIATLKEASGWRHLLIEEGGVRKKVDELSCNLDSLSKGKAVDLLHEALVHLQLSDVLIEWGGELFAAGLHQEGRPWRIELEQPVAMAAKTVILLSNRGLATSGSTQQRWFVKGREIPYTHLLNPLTMEPLLVDEQRPLCVTVEAPSCLIADGLSTLFALAAHRKEMMELIEKVKIDHPDIRVWAVFPNSDSSERLL